jgi:hypothetical protein
MFKEHYEYKILQSEGLPNEEQLNTLNKYGWKLITIVPVGVLFYIYLERRK